MPNLLYIGHFYHLKTGSTEFLREILQTKYEITWLPVDPSLPEEALYAPVHGQYFDVVLCFQVLPCREELDKHVRYRHGVFFPMYDGAPDRKNPAWLQYSDFQIINFSRTLHKELVNMGLSSHYIQYFPPPVSHTAEGDIHSAFFWQRIAQPNIATVQKFLARMDIHHIHVHCDMDNGQKNVISLPNSLYTISTSTWFSDKKHLQKIIEKSAIYIAPRNFEGIGMSFLEAMSMGRCVIAANNPTMNEYISHNETGFLYNPQKIRPLPAGDIRNIQKNAYTFIKKGYAQWEKNKMQILDWLEEYPFCNKSKLMNFKKNLAESTLYFMGLQVGNINSFSKSWYIKLPCSCLPIISIHNTPGKFNFRLCGFEILKIKKGKCHASSF